MIVLKWQLQLYSFIKIYWVSYLIYYMSEKSNSYI
jgi:hypothetical protein